MLFIHDSIRALFTGKNVPLNSDWLGTGTESPDKVLSKLPIKASSRMAGQRPELDGVAFSLISNQHQVAGSKIPIMPLRELGFVVRGLYSWAFYVS